MEREKLEPATTDCSPRMMGSRLSDIHSLAKTPDDWDEFCTSVSELVTQWRCDPTESWVEDGYRGHEEDLKHSKAVQKHLRALSKDALNLAVKREIPLPGIMRWLEDVEGYQKLLSSKDGGPTLRGMENKLTSRMCTLWNSHIDYPCTEGSDSKFTQTLAVVAGAIWKTQTSADAFSGRMKRWRREWQQ